MKTRKENYRERIPRRRVSRSNSMLRDVHENWKRGAKRLESATMKAWQTFFFSQFFTVSLTFSLRREREKFAFPLSFSNFHVLERERERRSSFISMKCILTRETSTVRSLNCICRYEIWIEKLSSEKSENWNFPIATARNFSLSLSLTLFI